MPFLRVLDAIQARMSGADFEYCPPIRSVTPGEEYNHAEMRANVPAGYGSRSTSYVNVPVVVGDGGGKPKSIRYPAFVVDVVGFLPAPDCSFRPTRGYGSYTFDTPTGATGYVAESDEPDELVPVQSKLTKPELPVKLLVELRTYAETVALQSAMTRYLLKQFPVKGALRLPTQNGDVRSWKLNYLSVADLSRRTTDITAAEQEFARTWTYTLQTRMDTADEFLISNHVRQLVLTME